MDAFAFDNLRRDDWRFPMLFIGAEHFRFLSWYDGLVHKFNSISEIREFVERYTGVVSLGNRLLVIDDLAYFPKGGMDCFLKFMEESVLRLVFLSSYDCCSAVFLSRVFLVVKSPLKPDLRCDFGEVDGEGLDLLFSFGGDRSYFDILDDITERCPKLYYLHQCCRRRVNRRKRLSFFAMKRET